MASQIDVFLLVFFLILSLGLRWCYDWLTLQPSHFKTGAVRTTVQRLRHRHAPQTIALSVVSPPLPRWVRSQILVLYVPGVR